VVEYIECGRFLLNEPKFFKFEKFLNMRFSSKIRYGFRVMYELAKSYDNEEGVFQKDISDAQHLPNKYLDQIIDSLKNAELIVNVKGKRSGYVLTRPPAEITMLDIHNAFSQGLYAIDCLSPHVKCDAVDVCPTIDFWEGLNDCMTVYFESYSLQNLLEVGIDKEKDEPDN